jgi:hypothetical protein
VNVVSTVGKPFGGAGVVGSVVQVVASVVDEVVVELVVVVLEIDRTEVLLVFDEWLSVDVLVVEHSMQLNVVDCTKARATASEGAETFGLAAVTGPRCPASTSPPTTMKALATSADAEKRHLAFIPVSLRAVPLLQ